MSRWFGEQVKFVSFSRGWLDIVHQIGGQLREIQYIDPYPGAVDQDGGSRIQHVFTNMHAISE